jgi:sugar/nucleoside kinase (ribokinase family)
MGCETITVTRGKTGTLIYNREHGFAATPALAIKVVDRLGAGDTVLAITALCAAKRLPPDVIGFIGNLVGAQAVRIVGNSRSIDKAELVRNIQSLLR